MGRTGFGWLRVGSSGRLCEHGNEASGSIKLFEEYPAPRSE
jgi:hypothetical protein